jgi:hypothetical protein
LARSLPVLIALLLARPPRGEAQAPAPPSPALRDSLVTAIQHLFDAMAAGDSAAARKAVLPGGHLLASSMPRDTLAWLFTDQEKFATALATSPAPFRERIWNPTIMVRQGLAVVWAPYDFHRGTSFSHCGVDVFTLLRTAQGWRITDISYTVEPTGCAPSPLGPLAPLPGQ